MHTVGQHLILPNDVSTANSHLSLKAMQIRYADTLGFQVRLPNDCQQERSSTCTSRRAEIQYMFGRINTVIVSLQQYDAISFRENEVDKKRLPYSMERMKLENFLLKRFGMLCLSSRQHQDLAMIHGASSWVCVSGFLLAT
jgi:hypothetical protein